MQKLLTWAVCVPLGLGAVGLARADDAVAIIDKAIKAHGGAEALAKQKSARFKEKGTFYGMGNGLPYTGNCLVQYPDKFRMEIEGVFTMVVNGDKGWVKANENTMDMDKTQLEEQKGELVVGWLTMLTPLKDKSYKLTVIGEEKVGGKDAVGVKITKEKQRDVTFYFDKENGMLVKTSRVTKAADQGGKEVAQEILYGDYKVFDGVHQPTKFTINRDGKKYVESEIVEYKLVEKFDDSEFGKP